MENKQNNTISIPGAIIIAGAIIAFALIFSLKPPTQNIKIEPVTKTQDSIKMLPVTSNDHILGNPNAEIKIVEYSDTSCPFCKIFHPTMKKIIDRYGAEGKVAWVYRHFPLDKPGTRSDGGTLHPNAGKEAQALECAAAIGGNDAFWKYTNRLYEITPSVTSQTPQGLDQSELPKIASFVGLDSKAFADCLSSERFKDKIENQYQDGINAGVSGTPANIFVLSKPAPASIDNLATSITSQYGTPVIISDDRMRIIMSGALPETVYSNILDIILDNKK